MVQVPIMALLGPAPAAAFGMLAMAVDGRVNRRPLEGTLLNIVIFGMLGLVGGLLMEGLGSAFGLEREDAPYALLVLPVYLVLMAADLALIAARRPDSRGKAVGGCSPTSPCRPSPWSCSAA